MPAMVKCVICGAVFEAGASLCPVCGVGPEHFVPADAPPAAFRRDTNERMLILGGGTAALSAAAAIRERNATCAIVMVTDEPVPPYSRPMLTKAFGEDYPAIALRDEAWYAENNILALTGRTVTAINADAREVTIDGSFRLAYDKCVYALGARCFVPPFPGADLPGTFAIRSLRDARALSGFIESGKKTAVVIGGGVLGLEMAWSLQKNGCCVTVLEMSERLMSRQLDAEASTMLKEAAERVGTRVLTGVKIEKIDGSDHVAAVLLGDGTRLPADLVAIACGVRPNTAVAQAAGAANGRAVSVNERMETSLDRVYACGDCAEVGGVNAAIWPVATEMGRVAGANAAGDLVEYKPVSLAITFSGMGTALYADGAAANPETATRIERARDDAAHTLEKRFYVGNRLAGVILLGDIRNAARYAGAI